MIILNKIMITKTARTDTDITVIFTWMELQCHSINKILGEMHYAVCIK